MSATAPLPANEAGRFLTAAEAHACVPGRSLSWVYQHMRRAGGRGGLVRSDLWQKHLETIGCSHGAE